MICAVLGAHLRKQSPITRDVLRRHYRQELEQGKAEGIAAIEATVFMRARGSDGRPPDLAAAKFWLERRVPERWREQPKQIEVASAGQFDHMSDAELEAESVRLEEIILANRAARLAELPAPSDNLPEATPAPCAAGMPTEHTQDI